MSDEEQKPKTMPSGWRAEWQRRRDRAPRRMTLPSKLPTPDEIRNIAIAALIDVCNDLDATDTSRVGAARTLLEVDGPVQVPGWAPALLEAATTEPTPVEPTPTPNNDDDDKSW